MIEMDTKKGVEELIVKDLAAGAIFNLNGSPVFHIAGADILNPKPGNGNTITGYGESLIFNLGID